jgi:hypothetical protein
MKHYLITFHESDGNDCTVYEAIRAGDTKENALSILAYEVESAMVKNGTEFEDDGSEFGYYFQCPDDCESLADDSGECCGMHSGGISLRSVKTFATEVEAKAARSVYHSEY